MHKLRREQVCSPHGQKGRLEFSVRSPCAEGTTIEFVGELTIKTIANAHRDLTAALIASEAVKAQVADDATVDLTFVQLIQSARRTAGEAGAAFALAAPAVGQLRETLERGGFLAAPEDRQFWLMQAEDR